MPFDSSNYQPTSDDAVFRCLQEARGRLIARGVKGNPCATNALSAATEFDGGIRLYMDAEPYLSRALPVRLHANSAIAIWRWHDASTTTHADVLALFDRAIAARTAELNGALTEAR